MTRMKWNTKKGTILIYTLLWCLCAGMILFIFGVQGKHFFWEPDGPYQHYPALHLLCDIIDHIRLGEWEQIKYYDFALGQGLDTLTTLNGYDLLDPVSIFSASLFFLPRFTRYTIMLFLKLYLTGFSFLIYCFATERKNTLPAVAGALAYTFYTGAIYTFMVYPNFFCWTYFLPFLLAAVEIYKRKKIKKWIVITVCTHIVVNYYVFYMNAVLLVLYVLTDSLVRIFQEKTLKQLKLELLSWLQMAGLGLLGVVLSAFNLVPTIYAYLNNSRRDFLTGYTDSLWHYNTNYYKIVIRDFFVPLNENNNETNLGVNIALFFAILLFFLIKTNKKTLKLLLIGGFMMLCVPAFGRLMNGWGYAANRWSYAFVFCLCLALYECMEYQEALSKPKQLAMGIILLDYSSFVALRGVLYHVICEGRFGVWETTIFITVILLTLLTLCAIFLYRKVSVNRAKWMFLFVLIGCINNIFGTFYYSNIDYGHMHNFKKAADFADDYYWSITSSALAGSADEPEFFRVEEKETTIFHDENSGIYTRVYGTDTYWSILPGFIREYCEGFYLNDDNQVINFKGLDGREALMEMASVKYYTTPKNSDTITPLGFVEDETYSTDKISVYRNLYALPIGYTFDSYISRQEYEDLSFLHKQNALMQAAVLDTPSDVLPHKELTHSNIQELPYTIKRLKGVEFEENTLRNPDEYSAGFLTLETEVPANYALYLFIDGVKTSGEYYTDLPVTRYCETNKAYTTKTGMLTEDAYLWSTNREGISYYLGVAGEGKNTISVLVRPKVTYSFDQLKLYAVNMDAYEEQANALTKHVLEDISVGIGRVRGKIAVPDSRFLQFSIPYSIGWQAFVDGNPTPLVKSNVMYMGLELSPGEHTIELKYETPYAKLGLGITLWTIALLIMGWVIYQCRKKKSAIPLATAIAGAFLLLNAFHAICWSFTWDESLTYMCFVDRLFRRGCDWIFLLFSQYCAANNHLLNTFGMIFFDRLLSPIFGTCNAGILRLPVVLSSVLYAFVGLKMLKEKRITFFTYCLLFGSYYMNTFFGVARGYSISAAFLLTGIYCIMLWEENQECFRWLFFAIASMTFAISAQTIVLLAIAPVYGYIFLRMLSRKEMRKLTGWLALFKDKWCLGILGCGIANVMLLGYHIIISRADITLYVDWEGNIFKIFLHYARLFNYDKVMIVLYVMIAVWLANLLLLLLHKLTWRQVTFEGIFLAYCLSIVVAVELTRFGYPQPRQILPAYPLFVLALGEGFRNLHTYIERRFKMKPVIFRLCMISALLFIMEGYFSAERWTYCLEWPEDHLVRAKAYECYMDGKQETRDFFTDKPMTISIDFYQHQILERYGYDILKEESK